MTKRAQDLEAVPARRGDVEAAAASGPCGNCGALMHGPYCAQCGEKLMSVHDYSMAAILHEAVHEFAHFDSKILRTLVALVTKPGLLTRISFSGGRSRYTKPLTLFVIMNLVFFVIQPHTGLFHYTYADYVNPQTSGGAERQAMVQKKLERTGETTATYSVRFQTDLHAQQKSLLVVAIPFFAAVMLLLHIGTGRRYAEHLVFGIHVYAFLLLLLPFFVVPLFVVTLNALHAVGPRMQPAVNVLQTENALAATVLIGMTTYIALALHRAYGTRAPIAVAKAAILAFTIAWLIRLYHDGLFYATLWTT